MAQRSSRSCFAFVIFQFLLVAGCSERAPAAMFPNDVTVAGDVTTSCGNSMCNEFETCSNCPSDCGQCIDAGRDASGDTSRPLDVSDASSRTDAPDTSVAPDVAMSIDRFVAPDVAPTVDVPVIAIDVNRPRRDAARADAGRGCPCAEGLCIENVCYGYGRGTLGDVTVRVSEGSGNLHSTLLIVRRADAETNILEVEKPSYGEMGFFAVGDRILLHQSRSATQPGVYEYAQVAAVLPASETLAVIELVEPLTHSYTSGDYSSPEHAQAVLVREYRTLTVPTGEYTYGWDWHSIDHVGGVIAIDVQGTLTVDGELKSERGFYPVTGPGPCTGSTTLRCQLGEQGRSYGANPTKTADPNGSGGGGGFIGDCSGGGGGGHGAPGQPGLRGLDCSPDACSGGTCAPIGGGAGAISPDTDPRVSILFGSQGGEGSWDNTGSVAGMGGSGGGIIIVRADRIIVRGEGRLRADGTNGLDGRQLPLFSFGGCLPGSGSGMGGGGGGAGGALLLVAAQVQLGDGLVSARGGSGGHCGVIREGVNAAGEVVGGSGGDGRIAIISSMITGTTNPPFVSYTE